jgi:pimeloyl-ACP methyl ester carboxylesterase
VVEVPESRYAKSGDVHLAYEVVGDGPVDVVVVPDWVLNVEVSWGLEPYRRVWDRFASFARLVLFDARGSGSSDPAPLGELATFEQGADDLRVVLDAVGSDRAFLVGDSTAVPVACLFAATHPERTAGLVLTGGWASLFDHGDGVGYRVADREALMEAAVADWGNPEGVRMQLAMPGEDRDEDRQMCARMERLALSPAAAQAFAGMMADMDVRSVLGSIQAPTLVVHLANDPLAPVEHGRYLASHIPEARYVDSQGHLHF